MKWAYSIQQKFKAAILLAIICIIVLITNLLGRHQMGELGNTFSSVYEDRLVVESYIFEISEHLYQKKLMIDHCFEHPGQQMRSQINSHNEAIRGLLLFYEKTLLTDEEAACLKDFKQNVAALQNLELQYLLSANNEEQLSSTRSLLNEHFAQASANLRQLSQIQVKEGKMLNDLSQRIVADSSLITSFELAILICIAVVLQIILLASRPAISRIWQQGNLN